jgi:DNA ligase-1
MFQPMLASAIELDKLKYPVYCSPKYDGIRCVIREGVGLSRKLKPIPNEYISKKLKECPDDLDGELIVRGKSFNEIQSAVMSEDGEPTKFEYHVFDIISDKPYLERIEMLKSIKLPDFCKKVLPHKFENEEDMLEYERECVEDWEFEGIMIRSPTGPYKYGRSTVKQGYLLKLKRFEDAEATIVGFDEMMHNENEKKKDELGHSKRSSKKAGMVPAGVLGSFVVRDGEREFRVSTGMTHEDRATYWTNRHAMLGQLVKYRFQESGAKNLPRFPVFLGIRHPDDT